MSQGAGILMFAVVLLVVVMIHEAGHFFTAKAFGIKVEEFFVGFGPRIWSVRRGETEYGVKALPLGGYVRIAGMNPFQEVSAADLPRTYGAKPIWQRTTVILAGPLTHFVIAFLLLAAFFVAIGLPSPDRPQVDGVQRLLEGRVSPAADAGLRAGDEIIAVDGRPVGGIREFIDHTRGQVGQEIAITLRREGRELTVELTPIPSEVDGQRVGRIGILLGGVRERMGPFTALPRAAATTASLTKAVVLRMGDIFGPSGLRRVGDLISGTATRDTDDAASIIGGGRLAGQAARAGAWDVLIQLFAVFNVFVGVLNLLPLPPLDGGHLAVLAVEKATGRGVDPRRLVPITALVAAFLILFVASLVYLDIVNPLPDPFR